MKVKGLLEYQIVLALIILVGVIQAWMSDHTTMAIVGFLFVIVYGISIVSYFKVSNGLIWLNNACLAIMSVYALIGLVYAAFQEPDLIIFLLVIALILIPLNVFAIYKNIEKWHAIRTK